MEWWNHPLPTLDLETTGTDPYQDSIIEIGLVTEYGGRDVSQKPMKTLVQPTSDLSPEAQEVHGISEEEAREEGLDPETALQALCGKLNRVAAMELPLVIYNATFDWPLVLSECKRHDVPPPNPGPAIIDPVVIDRKKNKYRSGGRKLKKLCQEFPGVSWEGDYHSAAPDALNAAKLARAMADEYNLKDLDLLGLHEEQKGWFDWWAKDLQRYFDKEGIDGDAPTDEEWPTGYWDHDTVDPREDAHPDLFGSTPPEFRA